MSIESQGEPIPVPQYPVAQPPPPRMEFDTATATITPPPNPPIARPPLQSNVPVATPAPARTKLTTLPAGEEAEEELLPPSAIKGWATSIAMHAVLLLIFAFWLLKPPSKTNTVIDTSLAGSPFGSDFGDSFTGGQGMDTPLDMPKAADAPALETTTFTALPTDQLKLDPATVRPANPNAASNGGGMNLTNPGQAGSGDGFGVARFGSGGEKINGVEVKVGDPQFTLIWDSRADIDLHVLEPGGSHIYWEERNGARGGELDVDDVDGFGPENVNWVQGKGPPGVYHWYVHYYGGLGGIATPTRWKVRLKHNGKVTVYQGKLTFVGERSREYNFKLTDGPTDSAAVENPDKK
jgi:hypothetical protein